MLPNRVYISKRATDLLKQIKGKTGVTPNILCRMALTLSLEESHIANPDNTDLNGSEFNLPTLLVSPRTLRGIDSPISWASHTKGSAAHSCRSR